MLVITFEPALVPHHRPLEAKTFSGEQRTQTLEADAFVLPQLLVLRKGAEIEDALVLPWDIRRRLGPPLCTLPPVRLLS